MTLVSVENLTFAYPRRQVFDNASMSVARHRITGIVGSNGAGKTTFFDILCGLRTPETINLSVHARDRVYLSQTISAPASLKMRDVYALMAYLNGRTPLSERALSVRLEQISPRLSARFKDLWKKRPALCSYGELRSFFTLSMLMLDAELVILDEPTAGVDPEFRYYLWQGLKQACLEGTSVIVSSHHIDEIATYCDRFYLLHDQRFEAFESGEAFMDRYGATTLDGAFIQALQVT